MGWCGSYLEDRTTKGIIERIKEQEIGDKCEIVYYSKKGRIISLAVKSKESEEVFAVVCLTRIDRGGKEFMIKTLDETSGPCYYDVPKKLLNLLSPTNNEYALKWREQCKLFIETKKNSSKIKQGDLIEFEDEIEFNNGVKLKTFSYLKNNIFMIPGSSSFNKFQIKNWKTKKYKVVERSKENG